LGFGEVRRVALPKRGRRAKNTRECIAAWLAFLTPGFFVVTAIESGYRKREGRGFRSPVGATLFYMSV
jgi:hypothetical protein